MIHNCTWLSIQPVITYIQITRQDELLNSLLEKTRSLAETEITSPMTRDGSFFFCEGTGSCILEERGPYNHLPGGIINYKQVLSTNPPEKKTSKQDPKENQI